MAIIWTLKKICSNVQIIRAASKETAVIGDDTDLHLIILHVPCLNQHHDLFLASESKQGSCKNKICCIK